MKIPKNIEISKCPQCIGEVCSFEYGVWFCPECSCIWKDGVAKKTKLKLHEFLAKQLKAREKKEKKK